ncbi:MAG: histidine kinase [Terracidiphilus sp.]|jgi:signal transduction histidine kinase
MRKLGARTAVGALILAIAVAGVAAWFAYIGWAQREPYFHDNFARDSDGRAYRGGWQAFGGTWQVVNGTMQNIADDRGAKLMNGNTHWHNYMVEADVQLLGETGDAGFVIRATQEEVGVDSYHGYFAGLRDLDDTLILGRADYGWHEYRAIPFHPGVFTGTWHHLKMIAYECTIAASATTENGHTTVASVHDPQCIQEGRFGLQSYSTGAVWRNVEVRPAAEKDLRVLLGGQKPAPPDQPPVVPGITDITSYQRDSAPMQRELLGHQTDLHALPIANLRLLAPDHPSHVTVQGVVTLVSPTLFVQDSSGGIAIPQAHTIKPVQIGDAVEASGDAELHDFSSVLRDANVRLLWSHTPVPPVSVTASQAATGAFDAQFIETEGRLVSEQRSGDKSVVLKLEEGNQSFVATAENPSPAEEPHGFQTGSRLRLRGICVTGRAFTHDEIPFALLMRSMEDAEVVEPPPWWNVQHVIELILGILTLSVGLQLVYASFKRSRLRAVIEERERLAHEMHDTLAQSFAGLGFQLETLCEEAEPRSSMRTQLESTLDLVRFGHMEARRNIAALRPGNLEQMGLAKALEQAAHAIVQGGPIAIVVAVRGEPKQIPLRIGDTLFRIGQEAIANAVRHARPRTIQLRLVYGRRSLKLTVRDDGDGFSPQGEGAGFGIRGMKRRATGISANFRIRSSPGHGTSVAVRAMLPQTLLTSWWWQTVRKGKWRQRLHGKTL